MSTIFSRIRKTAIFALAVLALVTGMGLLAGLGGQAANAAATGCVTTRTYTHSVTSAGSQTWEWKTKVKCGRGYQEWEHKVFASYTGSTYDEHIYRNEPNPPHYWQHTHKDALSKKGVETVTDTYQSA